MRILRSEVLGLCFGVRDALQAARALEHPHAVTIHGELVHNEVVLSSLTRRGFQMSGESAGQSIPETDAVLITAHGISNTERQRLLRAGKRLVDTTCPLVARVHKAALQLQEDGYHVLVIGRRNHVEIRGITGDLLSWDVIQAVEEVKHYPQPRLGIVSQTTMPPRVVDAIREAIVRHNPEAGMRFVDTVCQPTKDHQRALERLLRLVDAVVVVGGRNSNNTHELAALCREKGIPAWHVQGADDLEATWFTGCQTVGLTAGTSTLPETIAEVEQKLLQLTVGT